MKLKILLPKLLKTIPYLLSVVVLWAGISGGQIQSEGYMKIQVAGFDVFNTKSGISLTERNSLIFYNISPYTFYGKSEESLNVFDNSIVTPEIAKVPLSAGFPRTGSTEISKSSLYSRKLTRTLGYFFPQTVSASYNNPRNNGSVRVTANKTSANSVNVTLETQNVPLQDDTFFTVSINEDDLIFDQNNNVFTLSNTENMPEYLSTRSDINLQRLPPVQSEVEIYSSYVFIGNPKMSGAIKLPLERGLAVLNRETGTLAVSTGYKQTMGIFFIDYLLEGLKK